MAISKEHHCAYYVDYVYVYQVIKERYAAENVEYCCKAIADIFD